MPVRRAVAHARARGRKGGAPLKMTAAKVRLSMGQKETKVTDLCSELAITRQTLYRHIAPDGTLRKPGLKVVEGAQARHRYAQKLPIEAGTFYVMDRGYLDFARLYTLHRAGAFL